MKFRVVQGGRASIRWLEVQRSFLGIKYWKGVSCWVHVSEEDDNYWIKRYAQEYREMQTPGTVYKEFEEE